VKPEVIKGIRKEFKEIAKKRFKALDSISLSNLNFNPFLLRALNLDTPKKIAEFMIGQRLERSVVTSYGSRIQKVAKLLSERGTGVEGADIRKEKEGRTYYIQIKSGPNTPNKDITESTNRLLQSATRRNKGSIALLGMTYGNPERVSGIIKGYSAVDWVVGRDFWKFISDDSHCAEEIFKIIGEVVEEFVPDDGDPYPVRYKKKLAELTQAIREKYGDGGEEMWRKLFEDNM
jgi:hypothetical protein